MIYEPGANGFPMGQSTLTCARNCVKYVWDSGLCEVPLLQRQLGVGVGERVPQRRRPRQRRRRHAGHPRHGLGLLRCRPRPSRSARSCSSSRSSGTAASRARRTRTRERRDMSTRTVDHAAARAASAAPRWCSGAIMFAFLALPLCALGVDTARWWVEAQRLQAAADAAATAGVTYMPEDFDCGQGARHRVRDDQRLHRRDPARPSRSPPGEKPTQLKVTHQPRPSTTSSPSPSASSTSTITRSAVADFNGPAPMGSPCNTFGNEPKGTILRPEINSQLNAPPYASCSTSPMFWASAAGPNVVKTQGDQFGTRYCGASEWDAPETASPAASSWLTGRPAGGPGRLPRHSGAVVHGTGSGSGRALLRPGSAGSNPVSAQASRCPHARSGRRAAVSTGVDIVVYKLG